MKIRTISILLIILIILLIFLNVLSIPRKRIINKEYEIKDGWIIEIIKYDKNWKRLDKEHKYYIETTEGRVFEVKSADFYYFIKVKKMNYVEVIKSNLFIEFLRRRK